MHWLRKIFIKPGAFPGAGPSPRAGRKLSQPGMGAGRRQPRLEAESRWHQCPPQAQMTETRGQVPRWGAPHHRLLSLHPEAPRTPCSPSMQRDTAARAVGAGAERGRSKGSSLMGCWRKQGAPGTALPAAVEQGQGMASNAPAQPLAQVMLPQTTLGTGLHGGCTLLRGRGELRSPSASHAVSLAHVAREQTSTQFTAWPSPWGEKSPAPSLAAGMCPAASGTSRAPRSSENLALFPGSLTVSLTDLGQVI